jgi:hypothetical protein
LIPNSSAIRSATFAQVQIAAPNRERWVGSGLLVAEKQFRRVHGYKQIPMLIGQLEALTPNKVEVVKRRKAS